MISYQSRLRIATLVFVVFAMDYPAYQQNRDYQQAEKYVAKIKALEQDVQKARVQRVEYADNLQSIVMAVYARDQKNMGGYETASGEANLANLDNLYSAVMNEVRDYHDLLTSTSAYFNARTTYMSTIPSTWPVEYNAQVRITSPFGWRISPITGTLSFHSGLDIASSWHAKIIATADGLVTDVWPAPNRYWKGNPELGGEVILKHAHGFQTVFGHMDKVVVVQGERVKRGQELGIMGDTGESTGPHLHYEVLLNGKLMNPLDYLQF